MEGEIKEGPPSVHRAALRENATAATPRLPPCDALAFSAPLLFDILLCVRPKTGGGVPETGPLPPAQLDSAPYRVHFASGCFSSKLTSTISTPNTIESISPTVSPLSQPAPNTYSPASALTPLIATTTSSGPIRFPAAP